MEVIDELCGRGAEHPLPSRWQHQSRCLADHLETTLAGLSRQLYGAGGRVQAPLTTVAAAPSPLIQRPVPVVERQATEAGLSRVRQAPSQVVGERRSERPEQRQRATTAGQQQGRGPRSPGHLLDVKLARALADIRVVELLHIAPFPIPNKVGHLHALGQLTWPARGVPRLVGPA
eukprot:CAMPEP_0168428816 /NCGR_PEP_ID=MMETSP0228-20121227/37053_1 /TAXON_ID=133427 /ORGANISM="Protoceratium reticulatum, Strain CCCM 535 (=CCMP 1889)" /LENGTH=174 /DNA_ID=CAMNT_0008442889 /DNA_START=421 /DNA_END=944 /DNA_ORIENTATION=+